jgi:hypothetical protein
MKSSVLLAVAAILSCAVIVGCVQNHESATTNPPAISYQVGSFELRDSRSSRNVRGALVTEAFFQDARVLPLLGRRFLPGEYNSSRSQVVMLTEHFWQQQFGGDPQIIGMTITLNGQTFTVVGIMPTTFDFPDGVDVWVPKAG